MLSFSGLALDVMVVFFLVLLLLVIQPQHVPTLFFPTLLHRSRRGGSSTVGLQKEAKQLNQTGQFHRLCGGLNLVWLCLGCFMLFQCTFDSLVQQFLLSSRFIRGNQEGSLSCRAYYGDSRWYICCLVYDTVLGFFGVLATLSASLNFPHRRIRNAPGESGTLSSSAIVTGNEMREHLFYQILNLWQAWYLHLVTWLWQKRPWGKTNEEQFAWQKLWTLLEKWAVLFLVTFPWFVRRKWFPVHSFSANWKSNRDEAAKFHHVDKADHEKIMKHRTTTNVSQGSTPKSVTIRSTKSRTYISERTLYQIKKWQYIFYKHAVFHGLNISMLFPPLHDNLNANPSQITKLLPYTDQWRIFWIYLNTSYVMEFFLQSLVKRKRPPRLSQQTMLWMQRWLILGATLAAVGLLSCKTRGGLEQDQHHGTGVGDEVHGTGGQEIFRPLLVGLSVLLNFAHRYHDVLNPMIVGMIASVL